MAMELKHLNPQHVMDVTGKAIDEISRLRAENAELKEFEVGLGQMFEDGSPVVIAVDENNNPRLLGKEKIYLKSEADEVIAEKDEKIDELKERIDEIQKATDSAWSKVNTMYDELRHQKYKRSLAMAERWLFAFYATNKCNDKFYLRSLKYRELAMKFKEAE